MPLESFWRCDPDGESFAVAVQVEDLPEGSDDFVFVESPACPICGVPMRRVVGILDARDWGLQFGVGGDAPVT